MGVIWSMVLRDLLITYDTGRTPEPEGQKNLSVYSSYWAHFYELFAMNSSSGDNKTGSSGVKFSAILLGIVAHTCNPRT